MPRSIRFLIKLIILELQELRSIDTICKIKAKWYSMSYMEIALVNKSALRIKGKNATFVINPEDVTSANAVLLLDDGSKGIKNDETVLIHGAGEYEIGGVKITGTRHEKNVLYSLSIDSIDIVVGKIETLAAMQHKLKEHNIVVGLCNEPVNASFLTSLAVNVVIFYGEKALESAQGFEKDNLKQMNKYTAAPGKLPTEVETVLLS